MANGSRHGKIKEGWVRQGIQLPAWLRERFAEETEEKGHSSVKIVGTCAVAMYLSLPREIRDELYIEVSRMVWKANRDGDFGEKELLTIFALLMKRIRTYSQSHHRDDTLGFWWWVQGALSNRRTDPTQSLLGTALESIPPDTKLHELLPFDPEGDRSYINHHKPKPDFDEVFGGED